MANLKHFHRAALVIASLAVCGTELHAQAPKAWWPDPTTGLMWTEQAVGLGYSLAVTKALNWHDAQGYCTALNFGGYSDWRLSTVDEADAIIYNQRIRNEKSETYFEQEFKGGISGPFVSGTIWTSTPFGVQEAMIVNNGFPAGYSPNQNSLLADHSGVVCVRAMESGLLKLARDAQVVSPVPDITTLKASVLLNQARLAYLAGNYKESVTQSQNALLLKPDFAKAYWGLGISYGRLGQWDLAVTNLKIAHKLDKNDDEATSSLKWASQSEKAAKSGKAVKQAPPAWDWTLEPACFARWINGNLECSS